MKTKNTQSIKPKPKTKRGGAFLGKGTYGCVFSPNIECNKTNVSSHDKVSKVFKNKESMEEEYKEMQEIQKTLGLKPYINPVIKKCTISLESFKNKEKELEKCSLLNESGSNSNNTEIHQLIYEHKGTSLDTYLQTAQIDANFFKGYLHLLEGAKILKNNKRMHRDVKLPNLLKIKDDKFIFIDFGISCKYEDAFDLKKSKWALKHDYFIFPPEFKLVELVYKNIKLFHNTDYTDKPLKDFLGTNEWTKGYNCILAELKKVFGDDIMTKKEEEFQTYCKNLYTEISDNFIQFLEKGACQEPFTGIYTQIISIARKIENVRNAINAKNTELKTSLNNTWTKDEIHDIVKKYFENTCAEKADVFSLGISLLEAVNSSFNTLDTQVQNKLQDLIQCAIHFDPTKRITIEKMITQMKNIVKIYPTTKTPKNPPQNTQQNTLQKPPQQPTNLDNCLKKYKCDELRSIANDKNVEIMIKDKNGNLRQKNKNELCNDLKDMLDLRTDQPNVKGCYRRPNKTKLKNCMKYTCADLRKITEENELPIMKNRKLLTKAQLCNQLLNQDCEITLPDKGNGNEVQPQNVLQEINDNANACPA
jgi:serine/threonine protein kinase